MRRSRDELAKDIDTMIALRNENKTYRQIAHLMGYKSPGTISDLLRRRGHFSVVLSKVEIEHLITLLSNAADKVSRTVAAKLIKAVEEKNENIR